MDDIKNLKVNLESHILKSKRVVIVPHLGIDFDAIASALGLNLIATRLKKESVILVDDPGLSMDQGVKKIVDENKQKIIDYKGYLKTKNENDHFILTDVNKRNLIALREELEKEKVLIIDHHQEGEETLNANYKYITDISSASEIITKLLCLYRIKITPEMATYLLAGIYLDTNRLTSKSAKATTFNIVSKLLEKGGDMNKVNELFTEDFYSDRKVQELVSRTNMIDIVMAFAAADENIVYTKEELAKVADYLLKYRVAASFAIGRIDEDTVSVSARGKGSVNVGEIMKELKGGGNQYSAATRISNTNVEEVKNQLIRTITPKYYI